jgi:hypothetical protein
MQAMHRVLALLFLFIVPLQMSYAAVSAYCEHEARAAQNEHVGHHAHQHHESPDGNDKYSGKLDPDCAQCHFVQLSVLTAASIASPAPEAGNQLSPDESHFVLCPLHDTPYRPPVPAVI